MNLAAKYRPQTLEDVTEQSLVVDMVRNLCSKSNMEARNFLFTGPAGCGKASTMDTDILTPTGYVKMRDIEVGDEVFTRTGDKAKVLGVYPQGVKPIYRITLSDKTFIDVSDEHLNVVYWYNEDKKRREDFVLTTKDLIKKFNSSRFKLRIDVPKVNWEHSELPIDPYLVGLLLGDGSLSNRLQFSNSEPDLVKSCDALLRAYGSRLVSEQEYGGEWRLHRIVQVDEDRRGRPYTSKFCALLKQLGLVESCLDKFIPKPYLFTSMENRIALLQGLYDTDGYTSTNGETSFSTSSPQLSRDFSFLVRSLGIRDTVKCENPTYTHNGEKKISPNKSYTHYLKVPNEFRVARSRKHLSRIFDRQHPPMRNIISIEYIGDKECQCIYVDHPDHTYICGEGFIPTHNTTLCRIIANILNKGQGSPIEIDAASHSGVDAMREIVSQAQSYPVGCEWKCFIVDEVHSISNQGWQVLLKTLEESPAKTIFLMATTNPEKIPGTILSRVQTFQLSKISLGGIENRLKYIIDQENKSGQGITYEDSAISFIAKMARGGMRDSITLLEKAIAYDKNITSRGLVQALGLPNYDDFFSLLQAYAKRDNAAISQIVDQVYNSGINFLKWMSDFHSFVVNVMKYIFLQDINRTTIPAYYQDKISKYGMAHSSICLQLANTLVKLNYELKSTQYLQELTLTYLCFNPKQK